jgi:hypothetical protein
MWHRLQHFMTDSWRYTLEKQAARWCPGWGKRGWLRRNTALHRDRTGPMFQRRSPASLHTAFFLAAAAHCLAAHCQVPPEAHPSLQPFSHLHFLITAPQEGPGLALCASSRRSLSYDHSALRPDQPIAFPPDASLIPLSADNVTWQVQVWVPPTRTNSISALRQIFCKLGTPHHLA